MLAGISKVQPGSQAFGNSLEHLVYLELIAQKEYLRLRHEIEYWRTNTQHEVDFILSLGDEIVAIEVKGTEFPDNADCKGPRVFAEEFPKARKFLVCNCAISSRTSDGINIIPAGEFFDKLWNGEVHPVESF